MDHSILEQNQLRTARIFLIIALITSGILHSSLLFIFLKQPTFSTYSKKIEEKNYQVVLDNRIIEPIQLEKDTPKTYTLKQKQELPAPNQKQGRSISPQKAAPLQNTDSNKSSQSKETVRPVTGQPISVNKEGTKDGLTVNEGNTDTEGFKNKGGLPVLPYTGGIPGGKGTEVSEGILIPEEEIETLPSVRSDKCKEKIKNKWIESQAKEQEGKGEVVFRIYLKKDGKIRSIQMLQSTHPELTAIAIGFFRFSPECQFTPAKDKQGNAVDFIIEKYKIIFSMEE